MFWLRLALVLGLTLATPLPAFPLPHECAALLYGFRLDQDEIPGTRVFGNLADLEKSDVPNHFSDDEWTLFIRTHMDRGFTQDRVYFVVEGDGVDTLIDRARMLAPTMWAMHDQAERLLARRNALRKQAHTQAAWIAGELALIVGGFAAHAADVEWLEVPAVASVLSGAALLAKEGLDYLYGKAKKLLRPAPSERELAERRRRFQQCLAQIYQPRAFLSCEIESPDEAIVAQSAWTTGEGVVERVIVARAKWAKSAIIVAVWREDR